MPTSYDTQGRTYVNDSRRRSGGFARDYVSAGDQSFTGTGMQEALGQDAYTMRSELVTGQMTHNQATQDRQALKVMPHHNFVIFYSGLVHPFLPQTA